MFKWMCAALILIVLTGCVPQRATPASVLPTNTPLAEAPAPAASATVAAEKNIAYRKPIKTSKYLNTNPPAMAFDGTAGTWWSSGDFAPQWIEIDLEGLYTVTKILLKVSQSPADKTIHRVLGKGADGNYRVLHVFEQFTSDGQDLVYSPDPAWQDISAIKVESVSSPSWIGWREIMVYSNQPSRAMAPTPVLPTPTPLVTASAPTVRLYPGWESFTDGNVISDIAFDQQGNLWAVGTGGAVLWRTDGSYTKFTTEHGLGINHLTSVDVAPDGAVWFGTTEGVVRFDGEEWLRFTVQDGLVDNLVTSICVAPDGGIWFGTARGVSLYNGAQWMSMPIPTAIYSAYARSDGTLWFGAASQIIQFDGEKWNVYKESDGVPKGNVWAVNADSDGTMWFGTSGDAASFDGSEWTTYSVADGLGSKGIYSIAITPDDVIWFGTFRGGATVYDGETWMTYAPPVGLLGSAVKKIIVAPDGAVWFGTLDGGIFRFLDDQWTRYLTTGGLANNHVYSMRETPDGAIWFGTNAGVTRLAKDGVTYYSEINGTPLGPVSELFLAPDGALWVAAKGGAFRLRDEKWTAFTSRNGLPDDFVLSITAAPNGDIWIGTNMGISRFSEKSSTWSTFRESGGKTLQAVTSIVVTSDNTVWARSYAHGAVMKFDGSTWKPVEELGKFVTIPSIALAADGSLWFGGLEAGVMRFDGKKWQTFGVSDDGLPTNQIQAAYAAPDGSLWFGTYSNGVLHFDGTRWTSFTTADGLAANYVVSILAGSDGSMWFGTNAGATHYLPVP